MTTIAKSFKTALLEKIGEKDRRVATRHIKNIVALRENFDCNIYYLTSNSPKGFWNFSDKQITELKNSESGRPFLFVFLISHDKGYVIHGNDIEKYLEDLTIVKEYYKINEGFMHIKNIPFFDTLEKFVDLLYSYQRNK